MTRFHRLLISALLLAPATSTVYTGFNYGSFWGVGSNVKKAVDFRDGFNYAHNLSTVVPFKSARLFTCKTQGTIDEPTEAFDAAVETSTNLLLGFWMTPQKRGDPLHDIIHNELSALEKGFKKHGQALADLVIGLSVGSEDIYRWEDIEEKEVGVSATDISAAIKEVKDAMARSTFSAYMKDKPIGHVDTAKYAVVDGVDFFGMTAYPYWNKDPVANGKENFLGSLNNVKQRAGNTPVWIAEMGWPFHGPQLGNAVASAASLQQYWTDVGCSVIGMYTTFWFELIKDTEANQPDWGILDPTTHKPRIDLKCPALAGPSAPAAQNQSTSVMSPGPSQAPAPSSHLNQPPIDSTVAAPLSTVITQSTIHVNTTITITIQPSSFIKSSASSKVCSKKAPKVSAAVAPPQVTTAPDPTIIPSNIPWCVTVADIAWDGQYVPVAGNPAGPDGKCAPPPTYNGLPYGSSQPTLGPSSAGTPKSETPSAALPFSSAAVTSSEVLPSSAAQAPVSSSSILAPPQPVAPVLSIPTKPLVSSSPTAVESPSRSKASVCRRKAPSSASQAPSIPAIPIAPGWGAQSVSATSLAAQPSGKSHPLSRVLHLLTHQLFPLLHSQISLKRPSPRAQNCLNSHWFPTRMKLKLSYIRRNEDGLCGGNFFTRACFLVVFSISLISLYVFLP
jgi:glucan endo-1,3-beta-D-glucosidase